MDKFVQIIGWVTTAAEAAVAVCKVVVPSGKPQRKAPVRKNESDAGSRGM